MQHCLWNEFTIVLYLTLIVFFSRSNGSRISLLGDDWSISNGQRLQAKGKVPGTIHTALLSAKLIDEPYWSFGDTTMRNLVYQSWTFTKNFSLQADFLRLTQFSLHFDQVDTVANITLNECFLGNTTSMFVAYTFNVSKTCLTEENTLNVHFMSPVIYALNQAIAYNKSVHPNCTASVQHGECHVQFIRKEPCSFSWDWVSTSQLNESFPSSYLFRVQLSHRLAFQEMCILKDYRNSLHQFNLIASMLFPNPLKH